MHIEVVICTWNRSALLRQTLEQFTHLRIPAGIDWTVVVVNNNSTDATDEVLGAFADRLPLRRLFEPTPGKSHALNRAVRQAAGDYIVWTDDDVLVDPDWIAAYARAFERWPEASIFGGSIEPWFAGTPPVWLRRTVARLGGVYAVRALDPTPAPLAPTPGNLPYGANMAVRTAAQRNFTYDASLGPRPGQPFGGEETALLLAMLDAGHTGWWVPEARVRHYIAEHRQTTRYIRTYFQGYGRTLIPGDGQAPSRNILGRPLWLWRQLAHAELRYATRRLFSRPETWIEDLIESGMHRGQWVGYGRPAAASRNV